MIRVRTPSRLHFGLLHLPDGGEHWPNLHGEQVLAARQFGGVGLMIDSPGIQLSASPADQWSAEGPLAERVLHFAERFRQTLPPDALAPQHFIIERAAPDHCGLGVGTQLGLATAQVLAITAGHPEWDAVELARRVGRGLRSAIGVHGFAQGGFLVDAGKQFGQALAPLIASADFPEAWRIVIVLPRDPTGRHGAAEKDAFRQLAAGVDPLARTDPLCRLVLLGMLPALAEHDFAAFSEALYDFNARVGEMFAPVQGGPYASPTVAELVAFLRQTGIRGVGQSSWGHAVFAVAADEEQASRLMRQISERCRHEVGTLLCTRAANRGAQVESTACGSARVECDPAH